MEMRGLSMNRALIMFMRWFCRVRDGSEGYTGKRINIERVPSHYLYLSLEG